MHDVETRWLLELTAIPTAAGREQRVARWIEGWCSERPDLALRRDPSGNIVIERAAASPGRPLFITAHMDHPAFVVERFLGRETLLASFRGGVMDAYFKNAQVEFFPQQGAPLRGTVQEKYAKEPFPIWLIDLENLPTHDPLRVGDIGRWALPEPSIDGDLVHTHACDDLSAVAAALAAMERLRIVPEAAHVRLLFTRAEEIGFIGAIAACRHGTMPPDSRVIALENSRSFADSPIGGGVIVRVGDRISVFHPGLTAAVSKVGETLGGTGVRWQRKLMPGGACEASAFQAYGYESTCVCVPLGNYHNMANLERVQAGDPDAIAAARAGREHISIGDYRGMIALLEACGRSPAAIQGAEALHERLQKLYDEKSFVLDEQPGQLLRE